MAVDGEGHYETIAEYPNGGKDVKWVWDIEPVDGKEAWDEYEDILRFIAFTDEELAEIEKQKNTPTIEDLVEENKKLKAKEKLQSERLTMLEDAILELSDIVYS